MQPDVVQRLLSLNQTFYTQLAAPFAQTRARPQPGFEKLIPFLPPEPVRVLDVGCGEGRFGRFLHGQYEHMDYVGVDFSADLMAHAQESVPGDYYVRDISKAGFLDGVGQFSLITALAVLQHVPGRLNRVRFLKELKTHLTSNGRIFVSTWQFLESARQRKKVVDWGEAALSARDVEAHDYLLTWRSGGFGLRYVAYINENELAELAGVAGLQIVHNFRSDGREGDLNLYAVLEAQREEHSPEGGNAPS